ncbi:MAG: carboxypeptidase regulatory-like domain-containing protein, partial [Vicinamibacteria bacterium]
MDLRLSGMSATVENGQPVVPKHTPGGIRILVRAGGVDLSPADLTRFLGPTFAVQGELSGPGLFQPLALPALQQGEELPADPLVLPIPPIAIAGDYHLSNLRIVANGRTVLDVDPNTVPLKVIDQILVTQVKTRALTLDEIRGKGIVLDSDDYLGFEFTMGFKLDSTAVDIKFPVVFDRQGVAVPQPLSPPPAPSRMANVQLPTIIPLLLTGEDANGEREELKYTDPKGVSKPINIPAVLVIPGNVGYLKQFFSAQLYVSNGAPVGSGLSVREIKAKLNLPPGADLELRTLDDPLALPELEREGRIITQPFIAPVLGLGPDGLPGTADDVEQLGPAEQGQAEFLIRGEKEGFHQIDFDLTAKLLGLPIGPVTVRGKAMGGVLVRNPYFNVTFTVPSVVRSGEHFKMRATLTNIGKGIGNNVSMTLDSSRISGLILEGDATKQIATLQPGDAKSLEFQFLAQRTGKVVATYLKFDTQTGSSGKLNFTIGVGERNVPLSPDTLVLPASTDALPLPVIDAAMRVLGQAWSIANAPAGTLPQGVTRVNGQQVVKKALALAEAGLRITLGQSSDAAVRDLLVDFYSGAPVDPGFDQLLRTTEAGHAFVQAVGSELAAAATAAGGTGYEFNTARVMASAAPFISLGWDGAPGDLAVGDGLGRSTIRSTNLLMSAIPASQNVIGAVITPLGSDMMLGLITQPTAGPYRWDFRATGAGNGQVSLTFPRADGSFGRATWSGSVQPGTIVRVGADSSSSVTVQTDANGDGVFEQTYTPSVSSLPADGPRLVAAAVIGPETLDGAGPWGFQTALVFDRVVGEGSAGTVSNYSIEGNSIQTARRQLSGRLVFASLSRPEGPYVPTQITARRIEDNRGVTGVDASVSLVSRLVDVGAVVSGRVLGSEGQPLPDRSVVYSQNTDLSCQSAAVVGIAALTTDPRGAFDLHYVRQDQCGAAFTLTTKDLQSGAVRTQSLSVRSPGQQIVADFVMLAAGTVKGTVFDLSGQAVPGANVVALSQTETQVGGSTKTDALGAYSISGITVGPVVVRAGKGNGVGSAAGRIDRSNIPAVVDVTLDGGSVKVHGIIRKVEEGVPSPAAGAVVSYLVTVPGTLQTLGAVTTDSLGRYAFSGMPAGGFTIKAAANSRDSNTVSGTALAGDDLVRDISVEIPPATSYGYVEGTVVMPDGYVAAGVIVRAGHASLLSDALGQFRIPVQPQLSAVTVSATSLDRSRSGSTTAIVNQPGQTATGALITLSGLGAAEFTVLDTLGNPLAGRTVTLLDSEFDPCGRTKRTTDFMGRARFDGLGLGQVTAQVVNEGVIVDSARGNIAVTQDGGTGFGILRVETRASSLSGTVRDADGHPVFGADVALNSPAFVVDYTQGLCQVSNRLTHQAKTGLDGKFRFTGIHPGRLYVSGQQAFFPTPVTKVLDVAPTEEAIVEITLVDTISGEISGTVYEPDGMTSAGAGVEVTLNGALPDVTVVTNAQGHFKFAKIFPAGSYRLTARDPSSGLVDQGYISIARAVDAVHDIRLKGKARVRVSVTDALAQPVSQAYVSLREMAFPSRTFEGAVEPANSGIVEFPGVFEGAVSIEVRDAVGRGGRSSLTIPAGVTVVDAVVRVTTTGTLKGRFLMPDGTPIPYGTIKLYVGGRLLGQVTASADNPPGGFQFDFVPSGQFRLEALDPLTGRTGIGTGSIETEGQVVNVDVRAQGLGSVSGLVTSN